MAAKRKEDVRKRNITVHLPTYEKLDKFLFELAQKKHDLKVSREDAIEALLEEHYSKSGRA